MDIRDYVGKDEKIIYEGKGDHRKSGKQLLRFLLIICVIDIIFYLMYVAIDNSIIFIFFIIILLFLLTVSIYGIVFNFILNKRYDNETYYISDKKIYVLKNNGNVLTLDIESVDKIQICREKHNYGDVIFFEKNIFNKIAFIGIENPRNIVELVKNINKDIIIFDDRPIIMGKKYRNIFFYFIKCFIFQFSNSSFSFSVSISS